MQILIIALLIVSVVLFLFSVNEYVKANKTYNMALDEKKKRESH